MTLTKPYTDQQYYDFIAYCNQHGQIPKQTDTGWESVEPEPIVPTVEEQLAELDAQYAQDRAELKGYYMDFILDGDEEGAEEIKAELTQLAKDYAEEYERIKEEN